MVVASHGRGIFTGKIQDDYSVVWEERGPQNVGGRTRTMLFDPNDPTGKRLWAGSVSGGLWKVENWDSNSVNYTIYDEFSVKVGPVPSADGIINVYVTSERDRSLDYEMFDLRGATVLEGNIKAIPGTTEFAIDASTRVVQGMYFLRVTDGDYQEVFRVLVE